LEGNEEKGEKERGKGGEEGTRQKHITLI